MNMIFRADRGVVTDGHGRVVVWIDQSGNGNDLHMQGFSPEVSQPKLPRALTVKAVKRKKLPRRLFGGKRKRGRRQ